MPTALPPAPVKLRLLPAALLLAVVAGCRALPEPECQSQLLVPVLRATGPRRAAVNQPVSYTLVVRLGNSCSKSDTLLVSGGDSTATTFVRRIGVQGRYVGCACAPDTARTSVTYRFQPRKAGTYYLQFLTQQNRFLVDTLTVQ